MKTSDQINEISAALAKAQAEVTNVTKDKVNPHFKSGYASLDSTLDVIRDVFAKQGLALIQGCEVRGEDIVMCSRVVHSSGQWIQTELPLLLTKNDMQGMGSGISYARRYLAQAMAGIAQADEDNDGQGATQRPKAKTTVPKLTPKIELSPELLRSMLESLNRDEVKFCQHLTTVNNRQIFALEDLNVDEAEKAHIMLKDLIAKQSNGKAKANGSAKQA